MDKRHLTIEEQRMLDKALRESGKRIGTVDSYQPTKSQLQTDYLTWKERALSAEAALKPFASIRDEAILKHDGLKDSDWFTTAVELGSARRARAHFEKYEEGK